MSEQKILLSIISPCYNEFDNIDELYRRLTAVTKQYPQYEFEYLFIDNASTDGTVEKLKELARADKRVKVIINNRNYGQIRSPYWGIMQTTGNATIFLVSDLQDPPELIPQFIEAWEHGYKVVLATKPVSKTNALMHSLRKTYYHFLDRISDVTHVKNATGFGLYDREVLKKIQAINDPYPYFRGLIAELGYEVKDVPFDQPRRLRGISKNNFYGLYDYAMLGIISHSKVPIRIATIGGVCPWSTQHSRGLRFFCNKALVLEFIRTRHRANNYWAIFFLFGILLFFIGILSRKW